MDTTVILIDDRDNKIGYEKKEAAHSGSGKRHRAIALLLFNKRSELLLQRRKHKRWDDIWDMAGATDVLRVNGRDETYEESALRCLKREWGVEVPLRRLFGFNYFENYGSMCENEFCMIIAGEVPDNIKFNPEVAYSQKWVALRGLAEDMESNPDDYTPWFKITIKELMKRPEGRKLL